MIIFSYMSKKIKSYAEPSSKFSAVNSIRLENAFLFGRELADIH